MTQLNTYNHGTVCMNAMQCTMLNQRNDIARVTARGKYFHTHFKYQYNAPIKVSLFTGPQWPIKHSRYFNIIKISNSL
jgi:hypothetical protein